MSFGLTKARATASPLPSKAADMIYIVVLSIVVIAAAIASLFGSWHTRHDIAAGRPTYLSLADRTGIWDRNELTRLFGPPDEDDRYLVTPQAAATLPRRLWVRVLDSVFLDTGCIVLAVVSICLAASGTGASWCLLALCGCYQLVSWSCATYVVLKNASWQEDEL